MKNIEYKKLFSYLNLLIVTVFAIFSGGRGAVFLIASIMVVSICLAKKFEKRSFTPLMISFVIHCCWIGLFCCVVLPWLKGIDSGLVQFFFTDSISNKFTLGDSTTMASTSRNVSVYGAAICLTLPSLIVLPVLIRKRIPYATEIRHWSSQILAVSIPLGVFTVFKAVNAWNALAPVMSGDGRNNFLLTYAARSSAFKPSTFIDVGILPNALAGMISASNGATGPRQIADVWAIAFVYVLAAGFISTAIVAFIGDKIKTGYKSGLINTIMILGSSFLVVNPIALSFCLNDGFFSLYFALAIACSLIAITQNSVVNRFVLVGAIAGVLGLMMCYVILVPSLVIGMSIFLSAKLNRSDQTKVLKTYGVPVTLLLVILVAVKGKSIWTSYTDKALLSGAVTPIDPKILIICSLMLLVFTVYSEQSMRWSALGIAAVGLGSLLQYSVIEIASGQFLSESDSYYGTKIITATTFIVCTFTIALAIVFLNNKMRIDKNAKVLTVSILSIFVFFLGSRAMTYSYKLPIALPRISQGWGYTSADEISIAVNHWNGPSFLFLEYSNSLDTSAGTWRAETQTANDRLLNFWSPVFWNIDGSSSKDLYQWIYGQWNPGDLKTMCSVLNSRVKVVLTRSITLENRLREACVATPYISLQK